VEPLDFLYSKIAGFPGYDGDAERRRSDEYVRSYLGEALTEFAARCTLTPQLQARLDDLVLRLEFADPHDFAIRHNVAAKSVDDGGVVAAADAAAVDLADRAATCEPAAIGQYMDEVAAVLDNRASAIRAAALR
jgi:hypothetical protein